MRFSETVLGAAIYAQDAPKKVTRSEGQSAATSKVQPEYPSIARQLKIEGAVELEAVAGESGAVEKVNIVSGNPVLTKPAVRGAKEMEIRPVHGGWQGGQGVGARSFEP